MQNATRAFARTTASDSLLSVRKRLQPSSYQLSTLSAHAVNKQRLCLANSHSSARKPLLRTGHGMA
jgi:hypothetical protein